jgi:hypothetical protein
MDLSSTEAIYTSTSSLVHEVAASILDQNAGGFGSFTPAVYDTAWLAMIVRRSGNDTQELLFPDCFTYLIQEQKEEGTWDCYESRTDEILNSLAALLAILKYSQRDICSPTERVLLEPRISKAKLAISRLLAGWDVSSTCHVGYEVLVPSLLEQLSSYSADFGEFPGRSLLYRLNARKMEKFPLNALYSKDQNTLLHSLEAFVGKIDFQRLSHHLIEGSMLGSPSSTAAYLMESREWDLRAEHWLRKVERRGMRDGKQMGVPSAFPSTIFESSWVSEDLHYMHFEFFIDLPQIITTLFTNGISTNSFHKQDVKIIVSYLSEILEAQHGIVGFAPQFLADADDTSVALLALRQHDIEVSFQPLIDAFATAHSFRTYAHESSPSFSANCNVLIALLHAPKSSINKEYIERTLEYVVGKAEAADTRDKWNVAATYSTMLLIRALVTVMHVWDQGGLTGFSKDILERRIPTVVLQNLAKLLASQKLDGSWKGCVDVTAYGLLALAHASKLPWSDRLQRIIETAIISGRNHLRECSSERLSRPSYVWVEKVTYASSLLSKAYVLAAMQSPTTRLPWTNKMGPIFETRSDRLAPMTRLISKTPLFATRVSPFPSLAAEESAFHLKRLLVDPVCSGIFPVRDCVPNSHKPIIPLTWVGANHVNGHALTPNQIWIMIVLSDLIYQADEYMEATVSKLDFVDQIKMENFIREQCGCQAAWLRSSFPLPQVNAVNDATGTNIKLAQKTDESTLLDKAQLVLHDFIAYVLQQSSLLTTSTWQHHVAKELCSFLLAHIRHVQDNQRFASQKDEPDYRDGTRMKTFHNARIDYFEWLHTLAMDDTSCPFAFMFFLSLLDAEEPLPSPYSKYVAQTLCMHLGRMCRQYNDYGSLVRDLEEVNLNSLNFPEFCNLGIEDAKQELMMMAELERKGVERGLDALKPLLKPKIWQQIKVFVDVTDMYGHIYVLKDMTNRI